MVATNVGSLRDLMEQTDNGWLAGLLLAFGFVLTFAAAAVGQAITQWGQGAR